jgi:predicted NAD/FAD-binding protein
MKIAIIGSGIAGLSCAYYLGQRHEVSLFEKNDYLGGHTHTVSFSLAGRNYNIDTGFIVFNRKTYPNFCQLLSELTIASQPTEMSFSFYSKETQFEYSGKNLRCFYLDWRNLLQWKRHYLLWEIIRFNRTAQAWLQTASPEASLSLQDFFSQHQFSKDFLECYLLPMLSAIWSTDADKIATMPVIFLFQFFANHGLFDPAHAMPWEVIQGGSAEYVKAIVAKSRANIYLNEAVLKVRRQKDGVCIDTSKKHNQHFDKIIFAAHSNETLGLLADPSQEEQSALSKIRYQKNEVALHYDESLLPKNKQAWASWNYHQLDTQSKTCLTYYMNRLQSISSPYHFCVTVNGNHKIDPTKMIQHFVYEHPVLEIPAIHAQKLLAQQQGKNHTYFCGAYLGYGFHEDGVVSALNVVGLLGA